MKMTKTDKLTFAAIWIALAATPIAAAILVSSAVGGQADGEMTLKVLGLGALAAWALVYLMPPATRVLVWRSVIQSEYAVRSILLFLAGGTGAMRLFQIGVNSILDGNIPYGVVALITYLLLTLGFAGFLLWAYLHERNLVDPDQASKTNERIIK